QLMGLPDIGEPFDVETFRSFKIPDDRNAHLLYFRAAKLLKPLKTGRQASGQPVDMLARWSTADPEVRRWAEENREALELYRQGSERTDSLGAVPKFDGYHVDLWGLGIPMGSLEALALLEGSRLEERSDMAGAWGWYRAVLRVIHHVGRHGTVYRRSVAQGWHN